MWITEKHNREVLELIHSKAVNFKTTSKVPPSPEKPGFESQLIA